MAYVTTEEYDQIRDRIRYLWYMIEYMGAKFRLAGIEPIISRQDNCTVTRLIVVNATPRYPMTVARSTHLQARLSNYAHENRILRKQYLAVTRLVDETSNDVHTTQHDNTR